MEQIASTPGLIYAGIADDLAKAAYEHESGGWTSHRHSREACPRGNGERESRDVGDMDTRFRGYDEEYFHEGYHLFSVTDTPKWSEARLSVTEKSLAFRSADSHI